MGSHFYFRLGLINQAGDLDFLAVLSEAVSLGYNSFDIEHHY